MWLLLAWCSPCKADPPRGWAASAVHRKLRVNVVEDSIRLCVGTVQIPSPRARGINHLRLKSPTRPGIEPGHSEPKDLNNYINLKINYVLVRPRGVGPNASACHPAAPGSIPGQVRDFYLYLRAGSKSTQPT